MFIDPHEHFPAPTAPFPGIPQPQPPSSPGW